MTNARLAGSPWSMWRDIVSTNPEPIANALDALVGLTSLQDDLRKRSGNVNLMAAKRMFAQAQSAVTEMIGP